MGSIDKGMAGVPLHCSKGQAETSHPERRTNSAGLQHRNGKKHATSCLNRAWHSFRMKCWVHFNAPVRYVSMQLCTLVHVDGSGMLLCAACVCMTVVYDWDCVCECVSVTWVCVHHITEDTACYRPARSCAISGQLRWGTCIKPLPSPSCPPAVARRVGGT